MNDLLLYCTKLYGAVVYYSMYSTATGLNATKWKESIFLNNNKKNAVNLM